MFVSSKYTSPYFPNFTLCIKLTNFYGSLRNYDPVRQMFNFCFLANNFLLEDSRPIFILHEKIQPVEVTLLINIHFLKSFTKSKNSFKFLTASRSTIIRALELRWPLSSTKNIIHKLANLFLNSDIIKTNFPMCNIGPEDTYRRKIKLGSKTTGQRLNRALHAFHRLYQDSTFGGLSNIG